MNMKELAEIAGVSSSAVSRYLNGGSLSQEKREAIKKAIEETGYQPDYAAQMLRSKENDQIGLIIPKLDSDAVTRVTRGASQALAAEGYLGLLADTGNDPEKEVAYLQLFLRRRVAGIILMATVLTPQHEEIMRTSDTPIVVVGQRFKNVPCVYHDDYGAAYDIAKRIIDGGHKKLCLLGVTERDVAVGVNRRRGVEDAMRDAGLDPDSLIYVTADFTLESGKKAMTDLLKKKADFNGVICATDRIAFGAMEVMRQADIKVPEAVSVGAFDDNWAGEHILPRLTTAHFYYKECGETAANMLLEQIQMKKNNKPAPVMQTMLGYSIIERDSI